MNEVEIPVTKKRYDGIDLLKLISILMVVALHVPLLHFYLDGTEGSIFRRTQYIMRIVMQPVPYFVAINGFLMLKKKKFDLDAHIRKTGNMILLFFIWASILVVSARLIAGEGLTLKQFLVYVFETGDGTGNYAGVLWFMIGLIRSCLSDLSSALENIPGGFPQFPILFYQHQCSGYRSELPGAPAQRAALSYGYRGAGSAHRSLQAISHRNRRLVYVLLLPRRYDWP